MNTPPHTAPLWSTSAFGGQADTSPMELAALEDHLALCQRGSSRLSALRFAAETMNGFVSSRFVTTLLLLAFVVVVVGMLVL